jgi:hypothetical protein
MRVPNEDGIENEARIRNPECRSSGLATRAHSLPEYPFALSCPAFRSSRVLGHSEACVLWEAKTGKAV